LVLLLLLLLRCSGKREATLTVLARDNAQLLFNEIFSLPTQRVPEGVVATLPAVVTALPREKHLPKVKASTRWESFAKDRGIQHRKKSRMSWDEQAQEYRPRYGYKRAKDDQHDWLIEVPQGAGTPPHPSFLSFFLLFFFFFS